MFSMHFLWPSGNSFHVENFVFDRLASIMEKLHLLHRQLFAKLTRIMALLQTGYVTLQLHCYNSRLFNSRPYNSKTLQPQDVSTPRLYNPKTLQPQIFTTPDFTTPRLYNPRTFQLQDFTTPRLNNSRCYKPSCFDLKF